MAKRKNRPKSGEEKLVLQQIVRVMLMSGLGLITYGCSLTTQSTPPPQSSDSNASDSSASDSNTSGINAELKESNSASPVSDHHVSNVEHPPAQESQVLFSCMTTQNKWIEVHDAGSTIRYSFGPENQPEIVLNVSREQASTYQWAGVGRSIYYSVDIPNRDTLYHVFWSVDRLTEGQPVSAGVQVEINNEHVATVECADSDIVNNLIGVDLPPTIR